MASDLVRLELTCKAKVMSLEKTLNLEFALYGYLYAISAAQQMYWSNPRQDWSIQRKNILLTLIQQKNLLNIAQDKKFLQLKKAWNH